MVEGSSAVKKRFYTTITNNDDEIESVQDTIKVTVQWLGNKETIQLKQEFMESESPRYGGFSLIMDKPFL